MSHCLTSDAMKSLILHILAISSSKARSERLNEKRESLGRKMAYPISIEVAAESTGILKAVKNTDSARAPVCGTRM